jgi:hypothetical protein
MNEEKIRKWRRMFKDGQTNVYDEGWSGQPAICSQWWSCSKCWLKNLWKTALHNFRTFIWISTNVTQSSLQDYHS